MNRRLIVGVVVVAACGRDRQPNAELAEAVELEAAKLPGLQVVVAHRGAILLDTGYGFADLEHQVPVDPDTVFAIGSISKQFGAAAILQLVETGKLRLDDKLARFVPGYPRGERITIRDLLRHTSGIEDFEYTGPWPPTMAVERTDAELIALFRDRPARFEPNTAWSYSTSGYMLLHPIVERVTGQSMRDYLRDHVFARAGLEHTRFCDAYELIPHRAHGYDTSAQGHVPAKLAILTQFGVGGGLCSTARDLIKWQVALESGRVVSAASYAEMATPRPLADGTPTGYGYGLFASTVAGHRTVSHEGGVSGFASALYHFVDDDLRIAAVTNTRGGGPPAFAIAQRLLGIEPAVAVPIAPAELARYGKVFAFAPGEFRILVDGDRLALAYFDAGVELSRGPLVFVGDHTFEAPDRSTRLHFDVAGDQVVGLQCTLFGMTVYERYL